MFALYDINFSGLLNQKKDLYLYAAVVLYLCLIYIVKAVCLYVCLSLVFKISD